MSEAELHCQELYASTTSKDRNGRRIVRLPLKEPRACLGSSYVAARARLWAMERKFARDLSYYNQYRKFINDYIQSGYMRLVSPSQLPQDDNQKFYLPHHGVQKLSSSTTKLRVVFDASCRSSTSFSLNDVLHVGPKLQSDLFSILLKFRRHQIGLVADIEKMYRQILVHPSDQNFQLILWRNTPAEAIQVYQLQTVTYGLACSPYLAIRTLQEVAAENSEDYPNAAKAIEQDFYMDDLLSGADSEEAAMALKNQLVYVLQQNGFNLRKWRSNSQTILNSFSQEEIDTTPKLIEEDETAKILGVIWKSVSDTFSFNVKLTEYMSSWTKRKILSAISRTYDPLGWLSPVTIIFKIFIQRLWVLELDWDTNLPTKLNTEFNSVYGQLSHLHKIEIPRCYYKGVRPKLQLHAFCDAPEKAYGCVIYVRAVTQGKISTNIVCAKGKVAPLKQICIPRLELCGAYLLAKMIENIKDQLFHNEPVECIAWCDSCVVLAWLADIPRRWKSFIANRTAYILNIIPRSQWRYVPTKCNPADLITRGINPSKFAESKLWFQGPSWLQEDDHHWPTGSPRTPKLSDSLLERQANVFLGGAVNMSSLIDTMLKHCSSYFKLKKRMVYVLRFCKISSKLPIPKTTQVTTEELNNAELMIIRLIQHQHFISELESIETTTPIHHKSKLLSLDPFVDDKGILRVGSWLRNSQLKYSAQCPIVLPKDHAFNNLLIKDAHHRLLHGGLQLILNTLRQRFWILDARKCIKTYIRKCIVCIRQRAMSYNPKMSDLPVERVTQHRPFFNCGLDYAGPIQIKLSKLRNAPNSKAYIALFVCMSVKAVHLEIVTSLDTEAFIAALRRFVARRGCPSHIFCDNGSNFIGANHELKRLRKQILQQQSDTELSNFCLHEGIQFHFNPPSAPHFGGLWEATVKSVKFHLKRVVADSRLTYEEMNTMLIQIEAILNSRPLCRIYDTIDDLQVLTPGHMLIGEPLVAVPEPELKDIPDRKLNIYQTIQKRVQGFWGRWHKDYLMSLNQRNKWKTGHSAIQPDDVVFIKDTNLTPTKWPLSRVLEVYPGRDGVVRVAKLKTSGGELLRPVVKLIKLPVTSQH